MNCRKLAVSIFCALAITLWVHPVSQSVADTTYGQLDLLVEILTLIQDHYVEEADTKRLMYGAASGMVRALDPFSQFLEPEMHREMKTETEGQFGGLGIRIALRDGLLTVITPLPGTPAYRAGILPGDKIVRINGDSTQELNLAEAVRKLRGTPGTKVTISIFRDGVSEPADYALTREIIKIQSVRARMLEPDIGYVRIAEFSQKTNDDLTAALQRLQHDGMQSLVFDLRNNPGGLLNVAVDTCKLFLGSRKLVVYTEGRKSPRQEFRTDESAPFRTLPMVILVNRGSASGSEIVAGALQDHHRALVLGVPTFGKGSVQSVVPLSDRDDKGNQSGLRLTTAKYYTPSGRSIHRDEKGGKGGIIPDITIEVSREGEAKLQTQDDELYAKDRAPAPTVTKDRVEDVVLKRGVELLKAQKVFGQLKEG